MIDISPKDAFLILSQDAVLIDVREELELKDKGFDVPCVVHWPFNEFPNNKPDFPEGKKLIVACAIGVRSSKVANWLNQNGFEHVYALDGGILQWQMEGFPITDHSSSGHVCSCCCTPTEE